MGEDAHIRVQERENLRLIIQQWNANRLDLFEISEPDENLEFNGVMRIYFQDSGQKVATKCIRVSSLATTRDVIETLIEKFRPDMRMLTIPEYTLYEIHEMEERRLGNEEKPLLVQLNWNKDDREGRFLLKRMDLNGVGRMTVKSLPPIARTPQLSGPENFVRKLSRREKKELKKLEKMRRAAAAGVENSVAEKLYTELPETSFTRSISNPEAVMRRRRAQKLEKKLQQFRSKDGGPDTGGTLKIYGESLCKDVPYKTLLLSVRDNAAHVVKEMLDKYGLHKEDAANYCLVQCIVTAEETLDDYEGKIVPQKEYILEDDECPLAILMNHPPSRGSIMFQARRRPADHGQRKRKKKPLKGPGIGPPPHQLPHRHPPHPADFLPLLMEMGPDGSELMGKGRQHQLQLNVTEVGSDRIAQASGAGTQALHLIGPYIHPRHCVIAHTDGVVTVTPYSRDAETYVNFQRIHETTILHHGAIVRFGRTHTFRFIDPQQDDRFRMPHHSHSIHSQQPYFDRNNYERFGPPRDPILPAVLEFREDVEDSFFNSIITQLDPTDIQFKLAPTYTIYMAARFRASTHYRPDLVPTERAQKLTIMLTKVSDIIHKVIEYKFKDATALAFWMANASELLHFLKQDRHICGYSLEAQDILAETVQFAFKKLVEYMQTELSTAMPLFLEDRNDKGEEEGCTAHVLSILTNTMALLRRCRVNAALTIQLFSQLFHFVNMWVFNKVVVDSSPNYCTSEWGERIKERLARIELWAEKQGLELAADCHLAKLSQAALLLIGSKNSPEDAATVSSTCFKLNSLQLREILEKYDKTDDEPSIPKDLIDSVFAVAETTADGLAREDGREIRLEEEADLQLPFLLPEDGYSCDILRGIPSGLAEFLDPMQRSHLCRMTPQPTSSGFWTIYMHNHEAIINQRPPPGPRSPSAMSNRSVNIPRGEPEINVIELHKSDKGMGLSIVATKGDNQDRLGIYIKSVVAGGAADQDGRLQAGDQLLSVDGRSLVGISQDEAAQYMVATGSVVTLEVARQAALFHGLAPLLSHPSPQISRAHYDQRREPNPYLVQHRQYQNEINSQHNAPEPRPSHKHPSVYPQSRIQPSKSVPSLNSDISTKGAQPTAFNARTNSATLHQQFTGRSRSTQNLNEGAPLAVSGKHPSNPILTSDDDRHYQNISFHQGTPDPRMMSQRGNRPAILPQSSNGSQDGGQFRPTSAFMHRDDLRQESLQRPSSQQNIRNDPRFAQLNEQQRKREDRFSGSAFNSPVTPAAPQSPMGGSFPAFQRPQIRGQVPYAHQYIGQQVPASAYQHYPQTAAQLMHQPIMRTMPQQQMSPQYVNSAHGTSKQPPPTAPKPNRNSGSHVEAPEKPTRQVGFDMNVRTHPVMNEDVYRESPPPPPPPTSTHPLLQTADNAHAQSSKLFPFKNATYKKDEKYESQKRELLRRRRDEHIAGLEQLGTRTPQEDERLNTLKLEREFQRRAELEDDEEAEEEDALSTEMKDPKNWASTSGSNGGTVEDKSDEIKRKQQELEAAREAEERLLKEAQRRQEEEQIRRHQHQRHQQFASQRLDTLVGSPAANTNQTSNGPLNGTLDRSESSPLPPERGSSFTVMQQQSSPISAIQTKKAETTPVKKVQFMGMTRGTDTSYDSNANREHSPIRLDPNEFFNEADIMLQSNSPNRNTGNTPGVIGAQEVYRDPRQRRLLEQAMKADASRSLGPEKLTFREKMKMFAKETGDPDTPKDKTKSSKAQREIEFGS